LPSVSNLLGFLVLAIVIIVVPGPSVLFAIGRALVLGTKLAVLSVLGNALGVGLQIIVVSLGLGVLIHAGPLLGARRGGDTGRGDPQALAGVGDLNLDIRQLVFQLRLLGDQFLEVVVAQQFQLLLEFLGLTFDLFGDIHGGDVFYCRNRPFGVLAFFARVLLFGIDRDFRC